MVAEMFDSLLEELSRIINVPDLRSDQNNSCLIKMETGLMVQLEIDSTGRYLVIGTDLGEVAVGSYREAVFREALKANGQPQPLDGTFAYSSEADHLVFFKMLDLRNLSGQKIAEALGPFAETGLRWKESLDREEVPHVSTVHTSDTASGMFGL